MANTESVQLGESSSRNTTGDHQRNACRTRALALPVSFVTGSSSIRRGSSNPLISPCSPLKNVPSFGSSVAMVGEEILGEGVRGGVSRGEMVAVPTGTGTAYRMQLRSQ